MIGFTTQVHMVMAILASVKESRDGASANNYFHSGAKKTHLRRSGSSLWIKHQLVLTLHPKTWVQSVVCVAWQIFGNTLYQKQPL